MEYVNTQKVNEEVVKSEVMTLEVGMDYEPGSATHQSIVRYFKKIWDAAQLQKRSHL